MKNLIWNGRQIEPMSKILNRLYISGISVAKDLAKHNPNNIRFVINCTPEEIELPIKDFKVFTTRFEDGTVLDPMMVLMVIGKIHDLIELGNVLVCCHAGISRSPGIVAAYLTRCGMSWDESVEYVTDKRSIAMIHPIINLSIRQALGIAPTSSSLIQGDSNEVKD